MARVSAGTDPATCCPGSGGHDERWLREQVAAALLQASPLEPAQRRHVRAGRADAELKRLPPLLEALVLDLDGELGLLDGLETCFAEQPRRCPRRVPGRESSPGACGSRSVAAAQKRLSGLPPSSKSQTHAATTPPVLTTRPMSRRPATGSVMKCTTSWASAASNVSFGTGSRSAAARCTSTRGCRPRTAATKGSDGSTATTESSPTRLTSSAVSAPGPHPTSTTRRPGVMPTKSANKGASGTEYRPMNRS